MTGPEHYKEAERLTETAHFLQANNGPGCGSEEVLAEAQVHATLAVAAATALNNIPGGPGTEPYGPMTRAWAEVTK